MCIYYQPYAKTYAKYWNTTVKVDKVPTFTEFTPLMETDNKQVYN